MEQSCFYFSLLLDCLKKLSRFQPVCLLEKCWFDSYYMYRVKWPDFYSWLSWLNDWNLTLQASVICIFFILVGCVWISIDLGLVCVPEKARNGLTNYAFYGNVSSNYRPKPIDQSTNEPKDRMIKFNVLKTMVWTWSRTVLILWLNNSQLFMEKVEKWMNEHWHTERNVHKILIGQLPPNWNKEEATFAMMNLTMRQ